MRAVEFFSKPEIQLPLTRSEYDFQKYISDVFDDYLVLLNSISETDNISKLVKTNRKKATNLCNSIKKAVKEYLDGHPYDAYSTAMKELKKMRPLLEQLWVPKVADIRTNRIYRMRLGCDTDITREDIFHVPYDKRHKVATQRYSIPGLPCLYLGGSLYTCWHEMGCPSFEDIHVSAFLVDQEPGLKFLDFARTPKWIANWLSNHNATFPDDKTRFLSAQIILWPLIASCSIITSHIFSILPVNISGTMLNFQPDFALYNSKSTALRQTLCRHNVPEYLGSILFQSHLAYLKICHLK